MVHLYGLLGCGSVVAWLLCLLLTAHLPGATQLSNEVVVGLAVGAARLCVENTQLIQKGFSFTLPLEQHFQFAEWLALISYLVNNAVEGSSVLTLISLCKDLLFT